MNIRLAVQHSANPLHIYCRLRNCKIPKPIAYGIAKHWEHGGYRLIMAVVKQNDKR